MELLCSDTRCDQSRFTEIEYEFSIGLLVSKASSLRDRLMFIGPLMYALRLMSRKLIRKKLVLGLA